MKGFCWAMERRGFEGVRVYAAYAKPFDNLGYVRKGYMVPSSCGGPIEHMQALDFAPSHDLPSPRALRFQADEIYAIRRIVNPVLQAEWDLR